MKVYIFGTGKTAEKLVLHEMNSDVEILGFLDSDSSKWGKAVPFAPQYVIMPLQDIKEEYDFLLIASVYLEIMFILIDAGIEAKKIVCVNEKAYSDLLNKNGKERLGILEKIVTPSAMKNFPQVETVCPHGSHGSPINDLNYIKAHEHRIFKNRLVEDLGIVIKYEEMVAKYRIFCKRDELINFSFLPKDGMRYFGDNDMFGMDNVHILSHMINEYRPQKIIEVGSGFSSASLLDMNEQIFERNISLTFIEPYADRLNSLLKLEDNICLLNNDLQEVSLDVFKELKNGDILFVDSSHVGKIGSDVNYLIFEILPQLKKGVVVHFHDVFYPFEYPKEWMLEGRAWNEAYILRAFLQFNNQFEIIFWDGAIKSFLAESNLWEDTDKKEWLGEGSIYIRKIE